MPRTRHASPVRALPVRALLVRASLVLAALAAAARAAGPPPGHGPALMQQEADRAYERSLAAGTRLWRTHTPPLSTNGRSCASCHGNPSSLAGVAHRFPRHDPGSGRVIPLEQQIALCVQQRLRGQPPPPGSTDSVALLVLLKEQK